MTTTECERATRAPSQPSPKRGRAVYPSRAPRGTALAAVLLASLCACVTTPVTGRKALIPLSVEQDKELGARAYAQAMAEVKLDDQHPQAPMVQKVVNRLVTVAQPDVPVKFDWEVHVIDDDQTVNAWCMPGGKMAVYSGILPVTGNAAGLAVVMGHEIGHAVARHGSERMVQQMGIEVALAYIAGDYSDLGGQVAALAVLMPWGRMQELEADHIGLIYMARAGYDPRTSVEFWERMAQMGGEAPPEWLSTHPSNASRIQQLQELMPAALAEYEAALAAKP